MKRSTKLSELHPTWGGQLRQNSGETLTFDCPVCSNVNCRINIALTNPKDGGPAIPGMIHTVHHADDPKLFTVTPSVIWHKNGREHWHGWIERGRVISLRSSPIQLRDPKSRQLQALSPLQAIAWIEATFFEDAE